MPACSNLPATAPFHACTTKNYFRSSRYLVSIIYQSIAVRAGVRVYNHFVLSDKFVEERDLPTFGLPMMLILITFPAANFVLAGSYFCQCFKQQVQKFLYFAISVESEGLAQTQFVHPAD